MVAAVHAAAGKVDDDVGVIKLPAPFSEGLGIPADRPAEGDI